MGRTVVTGRSGRGDRTGEGIGGGRGDVCGEEAELT